MNKLTKSKMGIPYNIRAITILGISGEKELTPEDVMKLTLVRAYTRCKDKIKQVEMFHQLQKDGIISREYQINNLIADVGRSVVAQRLTGDDTYSLEVNYGALGDGTPDVVESRTELVNEVYRKVKASAAFGDDVAYIDFFYTADDTDGTYTEFGNFIDGTASADSGQLWSYIATGGWVKSNLESLFISCEYTISNA